MGESERERKMSSNKIYNEEYKCYYYEDRPHVCFKIEDEDSPEVILTFILLIVIILMFVVLIGSVLYDEYRMIMLRESEFKNSREKSEKEEKEKEEEKENKIYPFEQNTSRLKLYKTNNDV